METYCCCDCCGYVDIIRCEQLQTTGAAVASQWSTSQNLAYVMCDARPAAAAITAVDSWTAESGANASDGSMDVLLGAGAITATGQLAVRRYGTGYVEVGLFDGTATARYEVDLVDGPQWVNNYYPERIVLNGASRKVIRDHFSGDDFDPAKIELVAAVNDDGSCVITAIVPSFGGATDYTSSGFGYGTFGVGIPLTRNLQAFGDGPLPMGPYTKQPPTKFYAFGNEIRKLHIYRDGDLAETIKREGATLTLSISDEDATVDLSGDGSFEHPITGTVKFDNAPLAYTALTHFTITPSDSGVVRVRAIAPYTSPADWGVPQKSSLRNPLFPFLDASASVFSDGEYGGARVDHTFAVAKDTPYTLTFRLDGASLQPNGTPTVEVTSIRLFQDDACTFTLSDEQREIFKEQGSYFIVAEYDESGELAADNSTLRGGSTQRAAQQLYNFLSFVVLTEKPAVAVRQAADVFRGDNGNTETVTVNTVEAHYEDPWPVAKTVNLAMETVKDSAGNVAFSVAPVVHTEHKRPTDERYGATPEFVPPDPSQPLVSQYPLPYVDLVFDRPVSGVNPAMLSIVRQSPPDGSEDSYTATIHPLSETQYRVILPVSAQSSNTQWKIAFAPDDSIIMWPNGVKDEPYEGVEEGTTKLAARFMWAIGKDKSIGRFVVNTDPDGFPRWLQKQITQTTTLAPEEPTGTKYTSRIASSQDLILPARAGQFRAALPAVGDETFIPRMPVSPDENDDGAYGVAYFGMSTTIYPTARRSICECAAPAEGQIHASLLFGDADLGTITVTLKTAWSRMLSTASIGDVEFSKKLVGHAMACGSTESGQGLPQNMWVCDQSASLSQTHKYQSTTTTRTITRLRTVLTAIRGWQGYPDMATSTVTQACLLLSLEATMNTGSPRKFSTRLLLTKGQEMALVGGQSVDVEDTEGSAWTLQAS